MTNPTNNNILTRDYLFQELDNAVEYFGKRAMKPFSVSRNGAGEFTVTFSEEVLNKE